MTAARATEASGAWTERPLLFAHRGASAERPENTLVSFQRAVELGADVLELDLHSTRDGVFVVSHDDTGARTCNVPRKISEASWLEVSTWDAGWGFTDRAKGRPYAGLGIHPARFEDVLGAFPKLLLNVDIKEATEEAIQRLTRLLREHDADRDHGIRIWALLQFELWHRAYLDGAPPPADHAAAGGTAPWPAPDAGAAEDDGRCPAGPGTPRIRAP